MPEKKKILLCFYDKTLDTTSDFTVQLFIFIHFIPYCYPNERSLTTKLLFIKHNRFYMWYNSLLCCFYNSIEYKLNDN